MNRKQWIRRTLALALASVMAMLAVTGCAEALPDAATGGAAFGVTEVEVERKVYPYVKDFGDDEIQRGEVALYYVNGGDIPYVALSEYMDLLADLLVNCAQRASPGRRPSCLRPEARQARPSCCRAPSGSPSRNPEASSCWCRSSCGCGRAPSCRPCQF